MPKSQCDVVPGRSAVSCEVTDVRTQCVSLSQEDVEENVTMLDIEAALQDATNEAMGDARNHGQDLGSFQPSW